MASGGEGAVTHSEAKSFDNVRFLAEMFGFQVVEHKGQRIFGPPNGWTGPPPAKCCEIFVGHLPGDVFEDELFLLFCKVGAIYQIRLMMKSPGVNRGFCFIRFCDKFSALEAIKIFRNYYIRPSRKLRVSESKDNSRLYIGGLPRSVTQPQLFEVLKNAWEGVGEVALYLSQTDKRFNRGFAFVQFENHRAAAIARKNGLRHIMECCGNRVKIDWAKTEEVDNDVENQVNALYLRNLPLGITEPELISVLQQMTSGLHFHKVKIIRDFAFVHFFTRRAAEVALRSWDKMTVNGYTIEVKWARPPPGKYNECRFSTNSDVQCFTDVPVYNYQMGNTYFVDWNVPQVPASYTFTAAPPPVMLPAENMPAQGYCFADGVLWGIPQIQPQFHPGFNPGFQPEFQPEFTMVETPNPVCQN